MKQARRKLRILLVDEHVATVEGLAQIVKSGVSDLRVAITSSEEGAKAQLLSATPDLMILDLNIKQGSGLNVLDAAKQWRPPLVVVALLRSASEDIRSRAVQIGAEYFLENASDTEALAAIVRSVAELRARELGSDIDDESNYESAEIDEKEQGVRGGAPKPLH
jgi:DNA-binding NarL/FixJ family response regulator